MTKSSKKFIAPQLLFMLLMAAVPLPAFSMEASGPETVVTAPAEKKVQSLRDTVIIKIPIEV